MKEILETSKGRFVVCKRDSNSFDVASWSYEWIGKLSEIMEEELYNETEITYSMLHFKGIEITNNTYIFKVN